MKRLLYIIFCVALLLMASCAQPFKRPLIPPPDCSCGGSRFCAGNLIFVEDTAGMGSAIYQSTGPYTHVAIVVCKDTISYIYEALPSKGVICTELNEWFEHLHSRASYCEVHKTYDTARLVRQLDEYLGLPYDPYFKPDNGMMYCSELVCECFYDKNGNRLFSLSPMNFLDSNGIIPAYWQHHFDSLGVPVPQGMPGSNPNDMHNLPWLIPFKLNRLPLK